MIDVNEFVEETAILVQQAEMPSLKDQIKFTVERLCTKMKTFDPPNSEGYGPMGENLHDFIKEVEK
jgi:hypothetical protein